MPLPSHNRRVAVIGLGYVGLPVAAALSKVGPVIGFDVNAARIEELKKGKDHTGEVSEQELQNSPLTFTSDPKDLKDADFFIVAVPTPVDDTNTPDLSIVIKASQTVGSALKK